MFQKSQTNSDLSESELIGNFVAQIQKSQMGTEHLDQYDTGMWHLTVFFSRRRGYAFLRHISDPSFGPRVLLDEHWNATGTDLLKRIETSVYEHPALLDDYSADIVIAANDTLWIPSLLAEEETAAEECYRVVYPESDPSDLITEHDDDICALTIGAPGLKSFLARTFPGARTNSREMVLTRKFRNYAGGGIRMYVHIEEGETVVTAFDGRRLLCSATHSGGTATEVMYATMLVLTSYRLDPKSTEVFVSGDKKVRQEVLPMLRKHISCVMHTMIPSTLEAERAPLSASLASLRDKNVLGKKEGNRPS